MKISVLANKSGKVVAALIPPLTPSLRPAGSIQLKASAEHSLHEVDLPEELFEHLGKKTLATAVLKYRAERQGKRVTLKRA